MIEQLAIVSGKGGTGKTTLCTALGGLFKNIIIADCDVDAANTALIFKTDLIKTYDYIGSRKLLSTMENVFHALHVLRNVDSGQ
jgi:MinD superfamily P-loop ATPase